MFNGMRIGTNSANISTIGESMRANSNLRSSNNVADDSINKFMQSIEIVVNANMVSASVDNSSVIAANSMAISTL